MHAAGPLVLEAASGIGDEIAAMHFLDPSF
jgi:hypothetical protein